MNQKAKFILEKEGAFEYELFGVFDDTKSINKFVLDECGTSLDYGDFRVSSCNDYCRPNMIDQIKSAYNTVLQEFPLDDLKEFHCIPIDNRFRELLGVHVSVTCDEDNNYPDNLDMGCILVDINWQEDFGNVSSQLVIGTEFAKKLLENSHKNQNHYLDGYRLSPCPFCKNVDFRVTVGAGVTISCNLIWAQCSFIESTHKMLSSEQEIKDAVKECVEIWNSLFI